VRRRDRTAAPTGSGRDVELPPFVVPEPEAGRGTPLPAILSREWDWAEQTKRLKAREAYES
jgi:hypothetical protein